MNDQPTGGVDERSLTALDTLPGATGPVQPQYPIESVDRTLQLIEMLSQECEVRLSAVRDRLGIGQSTAHRLMAMLVYRGFAVQNQHTLAYRAGPILYQVGRSAVGSHDILKFVRPSLEWLVENSGETAHLAVLAGTEVRYLDVVESPALLRVTGRVGQIEPAHATSIGKAMLATLDREELLRRYARVVVTQVTPQTVSSMVELLAEISRTKARGWSRNREEMHSGVRSVGLAVVHPVHGLLGGLSVATPTARSNPTVERAHAALLRTEAERLVSMIP